MLSGRHAAPLQHSAVKAHTPSAGTQALPTLQRGVPDGSMAQQSCLGGLHPMQAADELEPPPQYVLSTLQTPPCGTPLMY